MKTAEVLPLDRKSSAAIRDWFMFVDDTQRTDVDRNLNQQATKAVERLEKRKKEKWCISANEAQLMIRWYHMIPENIRDLQDDRIYKRLENFIKKRG